MGTGVSVDLASDSRFPIAGLILQAPLLSIVRTVLNVSETYSFDMFNSIDKLNLVKCPVFVIHGTKDTVIYLDDGKYFFDKIKDNPQSDMFIVKGGNHNMMLKSKHANCFENIKGFIKKVTGRDHAHELKAEMQEQQIKEIENDVLRKLGVKRHNNTYYQTEENNNKSKVCEIELVDVTRSNNNPEDEESKGLKRDMNKKLHSFHKNLFSSQKQVEVVVNSESISLQEIELRENDENCISSSRFPELSETITYETLKRPSPQLIISMILRSHDATIKHFIKETEHSKLLVEELLLLKQAFQSMGAKLDFKIEKYNQSKTTEQYRQLYQVSLH